MDKGSKLYVQPAELARKLIKEMEDHKVSRSSRVSVCNRYTIFLYPKDYERLSTHREQLLAKLEAHLAKHARAKRYMVPDDITVDMVVDDDLRIGHFGILAERDAPGLVEQDVPPLVAQEPAVRAERPALVRAEPSPPASAARPVPASAARPALVRDRLEGPTVADRAPRADPQGGTTQVLAAADAAQLGLARQTIVIRSGNRVREFTQGRVLVGRAREADFRIDNPDVSRRHAAISWSNGGLLLEDLGSTNGTVVNGYPISSTVLGPDDVIVIGDCRMTVEAR